jgi:hypothetical protein
MNNFEMVIRDLTRPLNGQYPRPWMTHLRNPLEAQLFVVGRNQRNGFDCERLGTHDRHIDGLFNRNGETCRGIYNEMTGGKPSPTRKNTDRFVQILNRQGVTAILETNVICYSSPMSNDLRLEQHKGGAKKGEEIFRYIWSEICPSTVVVHGAGAAKQLSKIIGTQLPTAPDSLAPPVFTKIGNCSFVAINSLAPPAYNKWQSWSTEYLETLAKAINERNASIDA